MLATGCDCHNCHYCSAFYASLQSCLFHSTHKVHDNDLYELTIETSSFDDYSPSLFASIRIPYIDLHLRNYKAGKILEGWASSYHYSLATKSTTDLVPRHQQTFCTGSATAGRSSSFNIHCALSQTFIQHHQSHHPIRLSDQNNTPIHPQPRAQSCVQY